MGYKRYWKVKEIYIQTEKQHTTHSYRSFHCPVWVKTKTSVYAAIQYWETIDTQQKGIRLPVNIVKMSNRLVSRVGRYKITKINSILETKVRNILETKSEVIWVINKVIPMYSINKLLHTQENEFVVGILFKHFRFLTI